MVMRDRGRSLGQRRCAEGARTSSGQVMAREPPMVPIAASVARRKTRPVRRVKISSERAGVLVSPAGQSAGPSAYSGEARNLRSRRVIRMILTSDGVGEASRNEQPCRSA